MSVRVWARSDGGRFEWKTLTSKYLSQTIEVFRKSFYVNEPVCMVTGISKTEKGSEQFDEFIVEIAQDGVSIIAVEVATDKVVGAAISKLQFKDDPEVPIFQKYLSKEDLDPSFKEILNFVDQLEAKVDIFEHYSVGNMMDFMFLATHPDYYCIGIGLKSVKAVLEMAKALCRGEDVVVPISEDRYPWKKIPPPRPEIVIGLFTTPITQKMARKLGWDEVTEVSYEELFQEGKSYALRLDKSNNRVLFMATKISEK